MFVRGVGQGQVGTRAHVPVPSGYGPELNPARGLRGMRVTERCLLALGVSVASLALAVRLPAAAQTPGRDVRAIRIGYAVSKTGPYSTGASVTTIPNYRLWVHDVNARGGIFLRSLNRRVPVEVVEYDDRSSPEEAIRAIQRLVNQDRVDFLLPPWGTAMNLAVAPVFAQAGYPHLGVTNLSDRTSEVASRYPTYMSFLGTSSQYAEAVFGLLGELYRSGKIGRRVAMVYVDDAFGLELSSAARQVVGGHGLELVYAQAYPLGIGDLQPIIVEAMRRSADAFVAFSYPPDTFGLARAAKVLGFNPGVFYTAVGTAFPIFRDQLGADAEGVMGIGGWDPARAEIQEYLRRHRQVTGQEPDRWASAVTYASLQVLEQAIERVGTIDRKAVLDAIKGGSFETIIGTVKLDSSVYYGNWLVGQWQRGDFVAVWPAGRRGAAQAMVPKPQWSR